VKTRFQAFAFKFNLYRYTTVRQRREAIEEAQTAALKRRARQQTEAQDRAALARMRAEADNAEWRATTAKKRQEKFATAEAHVEYRLLGASLERSAKLEAAEDLHAVRMRELSRREVLRWGLAATFTVCLLATS
jgi:hypothetical protein